MQPNCGAYKKRSEKPSYFNIILRIIGIFAVLAIIYSFITLNKEGTTCLSQPYLYGAKKMAEQFKGEVYCSCQVRGEDGSFKTYSFNQFQENPNTLQYLNVINISSTKVLYQNDD